MVLDVENNEMVTEKVFLRNSNNIIIEYDGKKVGFDFKRYQKYVKKPDSDAVFVPCVFVDATEYNTERNFLKENESAIDAKLKELDTDNDEMLTEEEILKFFNGLGVSDWYDMKGLEKLPFEEVKKIFDIWEYRVNYTDNDFNKKYNKIKKFENETEEDFKKKFQKYLSTSSFGFFKSNAMVLQDEIENFYNKGKQYIVLKKTKNKMSFIGVNSTLHNPDFYSNLQISELINESGMYDKLSMSNFNKPYENTVYRSLKREFFTGPNKLQFKSMKTYKGEDFRKINGLLHYKFTGDKNYFNAICGNDARCLYEISRRDPSNYLKISEVIDLEKHIKNLDSVFINVAPRSKDIITVFRGGLPLLSTHNPSFISTTTDPRVITVFHKNFMEIKIRPGTPYLVLFISDGEKEILLPRGLFFKKLGEKERLITSTETKQITVYEAYLPKYDPTDPINIKMETPHYNKYYDEVCKDFHILEVDDVASEKSPKKEKRKSSKKSNSSGIKRSNKSSSKGSRKKQKI